MLVIFCVFLVDFVFLIYLLTRANNANNNNSRQRGRQNNGHYQINHNNINLNANNRQSTHSDVVQSHSSPPVVRPFNRPSGGVSRNAPHSTSWNKTSKPLNVASDSDSSGSLKNGKKKFGKMAPSKSGKSQTLLAIEAYKNEHPSQNSLWPIDVKDNRKWTKNINEDKKKMKKDAFTKIWDTIKCPFISQKQQNDSVESGRQSSEVMRHESPQKLSRNARKKRGSKSSISSESSQESNYVPLQTSAIIYIQKLISDIYGLDRWKAITDHFKNGQWIGEDDVTNLIRLAAACFPFPQKFAWVTSETMSTTIAGYDYFQGLENYSNNTEFVILPCCSGVHFTFWTYNIKNNDLTYYDPKNERPQYSLQQAARNVIQILFDPPSLPGFYIQTIPEAMRQKSNDSFNCGIIIFDIILCLMKNQPLFTINYSPNVSRRKYFQLLKTVYENQTLPTSYFLESETVIQLPKLPSPENIENDEPMIIDDVQPTTEEKRTSKISVNDAKLNQSIILRPKKTRTKTAQIRRTRFQNFESRDSKELKKAVLPKIQKIKKLTKGNVEPKAKSQFFQNLAEKRWSTWNSKRVKIEQSRAKSREAKNKAEIDTDSIDFDDFDYSNDAKCKPDLAVKVPTPPTVSPIPPPIDLPKLKYTPRVINKTPSAVWKQKKRLQEQLKPMFPGYRPEIVLHPDNVTPENPMEKYIDLKISGQLKKRQVEKLSKGFKAPSYPTLMKRINATIPDIPDAPHADIEGRNNLIFKDYYSFVVARIQNSNKLPKEGPIRISNQADTGDGRTLFTFNFVDVENPNSPSNHACFAMFDGSDKAENITDITDNVNAGAERLQREGIVVNGIRREVICFLNGDLKIRCGVCGCQGGNAKRFCCKCKTEKDKELGELRTIEEISKNFADLQAEYLSGKQSAHRYGQLKQKYNSVNGPPLIPCIPLTRVCPPPLHLLMALLNKFLFFIMCDDEIKEFLKIMNVETIPGRSELTGNACRQILNKISGNPKKYKVPQKDIFILIGKIEKYAEARKLTPKEISVLEKLITELFEKLDTFHDFNQGNKLHEIRYHLIPFLREHGSWGLFSEQGLEALHLVFKNYREKIIATEDDPKKNKFAFQSHMQLIFAMKM